MEVKNLNQEVVTKSASPQTTLLPQEHPLPLSLWNPSTIATLLWKNPQAHLSDDMVKKVNSVAFDLKSKGFELSGVPADGNCFLNAFLQSYQTLPNRKIPSLDQENDKVAYLRSSIAAEYPLGKAVDHLNPEAAMAAITSRVNQIKRNGEWITAMDEGDLLARALSIPIRIITVHQDQNGSGISDMLTLPDRKTPRQEWNTIAEKDRPKEYIFIVDLGGHFVYAKKAS